MSLPLLLPSAVSDTCGICQKCHFLHRGKDFIPSSLMFSSCQVLVHLELLSLALARPWCCYFFWFSMGFLEVVGFPNSWSFGIGTWSLLISTSSLKLKSHSFIIPNICLSFSNSGLDKTFVKISAA
jgi:hypothetical protein